MNIAVIGRGTMGKLVAERAETMPEIGRIQSIEPLSGETLQNKERPDILIDFSHPDVLHRICDYASAQDGKTGVVFATTGFSEEDEREILRLAETVPVLKSANFSFGVYALKRIIGCATELLGEKADIEIVEKHHRNKADAPSGTALALAQVCDPAHTRFWNCGRRGLQKRGQEIGIQSVRGGTITGEHEVIFAMNEELLTVSHSAFSKKIFAEGALKAALWLQGREPGLYTFEDIFS